MKKILYLGVDPKHLPFEGPICHVPLIAAKKRPIDELSLAFSRLKALSHVILTSKVAVQFYREVLQELSLSGEFSLKEYLVTGRITASYLQEAGASHVLVPEDEHAEGVCSLFKEGEAYFYPHSARARPLITEKLEQDHPGSLSFPLYDVFSQKPSFTPNFAEMSAIVFSSPSTVEAFQYFFPNISLSHYTLWSQGRQTTAALLRINPLLKVRLFSSLVVK